MDKERTAAALVCLQWRNKEGKRGAVCVRNEGDRNGRGNGVAHPRCRRGRGSVRFGRQGRHEAAADGGDGDVHGSGATVVIGARLGGIEEAG